MGVVLVRLLLFQASISYNFLVADYQYRMATLSTSHFHTLVKCGCGPGSSTAISSTLGLSNPVSSTIKFLISLQNYKNNLLAYPITKSC